MMRTIKVPFKLRFTSLLLMLSVPFVALQTIIAARAPWWDLPINSIQIWSLSVALISFPLAIWIANGKRWAYQVTFVFASAWCLLSVGIAIHLGHFWLNVFVLFLILFWIVVLSKIRLEMGRSFLDPKIEWYQGLPKIIPGLECELADGEKAVPGKVARFDEDGSFIVFQEPIRLKYRGKKKFDLAFSFDDKKIKCQGRLVRALDQFDGLGFQFMALSADQQKETRDFVEVLRGKGYVS